MNQKELVGAELAIIASELVQSADNLTRSRDVLSALLDSESDGSLTAWDLSIINGFVDDMTETIAMLVET